MSILKSLLSRSRNIQGLDLATDQTTLDIAAFKARRLDRELRRKVITETEVAANDARKEATGVLFQTACELLGDKDPCILSLISALENDESCRQDLDEAFFDPSWDDFQAARRVALAAIKRIVESTQTIRDEIEKEKLRRKSSVEKLTIEAETPLLKLGQTRERLLKFLLVSSPTPGQLQQCCMKIDKAAVIVASYCDKGSPLVFDQAVQLWELAIAGSAVELKNADKAEQEERDRRDLKEKELRQRLTVEPCSKMEPLLVKLGKHPEDFRLVKAKAGVEDSKLTIHKAFLDLTNSLDGPAEKFDELAKIVELQLDGVVLKINTGESEAAARLVFTNFCTTHKVILMWGGKQERYIDCFMDPRIDKFQVYWKKASGSRSLTWCDIETANEFSTYPTILETTKQTMEEVMVFKLDIETRINTCVLKFDEIKLLCGDLDIKVSSLDTGYPNCAALRDLVEGNQISDLTMIENMKSYGGLDNIKKEFQEMLVRWPANCNSVTGEVDALKILKLSKPLVNGGLVILWSIGLSADDVKEVLPMGCGNLLKIAQDIVNQPFAGQTGFTCGGRTVYHSSAGSGKQSSATMGTAFWIMHGGANEAREIIAMGKHDPLAKTNDKYVIKWNAPGVTVTSSDEKGRQLVQLNSSEHYLS